MKFRVIYQQTSHNARSPIHIIEPTSGREVGWINRYLDREYVRRLADTTLRTYAHNSCSDEITRPHLSRNDHALSRCGLD